MAKGDRFCPGCGTTVAEPMDTATAQTAQSAGTNMTQCVHCATPMGRDDRFCPKCGTSRPAEATVISHVSLRNAQAGHLIEATKGEFDIIQTLGTGAMGAVYLAKDIALSRNVAIKVIAPNLLSDESMISRFRLEAQTVASLRHPNIVNVHAVRQSDDLHYFVMEFIDGPPLRSIVKGHAPLDVDVVKSLLFQVGSALSYAHRTGGGVIHRDIKPANIMVDKDGSAFVTDFGISKIAEAQSGLTQTGATIGTPEYMSPEQCRGEPLTGASDQYALGIVAYEMLCGHTPFSGTQYYIMVAHTSEAPKPIREVRPDCPAEVADAVERMLAKEAHARWPDLDTAVAAMGGGPLGYQSPIRTKIVALTGATVPNVPAVDTRGSRSEPDVADTATSVTVTGIPSVVEIGDTFTLAADVKGTGQGSLTGLGVVWASTDPSIAKVDAGVVEALQRGSVSITAMAGNVASSVLLTVEEPKPAKVLVRPGSVRIQQGGRIGLAATVQDRKGRPMERDVRWRTSDAAIATVAEDGQVVATGSGPVSIVAESDGVTGTAEIIVEAPIGATAPPKAVATPPAQPAKATPFKPAAAPPKAPAPKAPAKPSRPKPSPSRPRPQPTGPRPVYRRPPVIAASIVGLLLVGFGVMNLVGGGGESTPTPVGTAATPTPESGGAAQVEPPIGAGGPAAVDPDPPATTTSGTPAATTPAPATTAPTPAATTPPPSTTAATPPPAASTTPPPAAVPTPRQVEIDLTSTAMAVGGTQTAAAQVFADGGTRMTSGFTLSWRSSDTSVLSVDTRGALRGTGAGTAYLVATAGSARDSILVAVAAVVASVEIAPSDLALEVGGSGSLSAVATDPSGARLERAIAWSSSVPGVASVDARSGRVTATSAGTTRITATADGISDAVTVTVAAPAPTLPTGDFVTGAITAYLGFLTSKDEDAIRRLWGTADEDGLDDLLDLIDENRFSATLGTVGAAAAQGGAATVPFAVNTVYRTFAGAERRSTQNFLGRFERSGSNWVLQSAVIQ